MAICGWCITDHHAACRKVITHYDQSWTCACSTCSSDSESEPKKAVKPPKPP